MGETEKYNVGFVDSGTTFTYLPKNLFMIFKVHFKVYCEFSESNCLGELLNE